MATNLSKKSVSINPLKVSQPLGGTLAMQGFYKSIPIIHGSQGCAAFIKALMTRHFRDPISIQTSALQEMNVIFGGVENLYEAIDNVIEKHDPDIISVLSTSLTEVAGDDIQANIKDYLKKNYRENKLVVGVSLPDFVGSLESGYNQTVDAIVSAVLEQTKSKVPKVRLNQRINLLVGSHLTPADVIELKDIITSYGFEVIAIPDLSTSLSGHLLEGFTPLSRGGVPLDYLEQLVTAKYTIAIGASMQPIAEKIFAYTGIPFQVFPSVTGLLATDALFTFLQSISRENVPLRYMLQRENLVDAMLDAHFYYLGSSAVVALEPDHLYSISSWLREMGVELKRLVTTHHSPVIHNLAEEVVIGDLDDLEVGANKNDVWISNSQGKQGAIRKECSYMPMGFPVYHILGAVHATSVGYRGTLELVNKVGNLLMERKEEHNHESSFFFNE
ncbi:nitrogenase iron-molybdenum cofactor biosynthesis protein NifN [Anaerobacillus alkalidiazotrophicus]|uniref:Nitrogenase iron-molybdenum cofactor biosynthesis protein NifN n=1 Tax=Anaerobacillus alkalidiazotrophicus TaxID=472963 RepID=A0A1S2M9U0_9BACI|nr:nitrogenase iron-molybdenum cofactor biosynthesis protein NifN [Anaerobacillus alkalidiazotrophicus]OIJ21253.1 nitrogenase iron-molybdenum cofactor biosynthesis protein NifN [Anaerobacillus alkalidiazotrophicus]